jgi:endonuclease YncB( thermonuclease family)
VVDGDTLDVDEPDGDKPATRIRLWGVDTPETKARNKPVQHFGPEAAAFTTRTCEGKTVRLQLLPGKTRDNYHRLLAYVMLGDGATLNSELIRQGYGYADPRFDHPAKVQFLELQARARQARMGLWKDLKPTDLPYYMSN